MLRITIEDDKIYEYEDIYGRIWTYEKDAVIDKLNSFNEITESNWSRLATHINNGCFMISACRGDKSEKENKVRTESLAKDLRFYKLEYVRVLGGYVEEAPGGMKREVVEESFFVPQPKDYEDEKFFDIAIELCKKYEQDSVLISMPDYIEFGYYNKNGDFEFSPGNKLVFTDKSIGSYFSQLVKGTKRNTKWAFTNEWLAIRHPSSVMQAAIMEQSGELI